MPRAAALCGWLRSLTALAGAALVAACSASTSNTPTTGSHSATPQDVAQGYACTLASFREPGRAHSALALGVISIADESWPTASVDQGWWRYWQKHGLWIWTGHQAVTITVPKAWRNRAAITWGENVGIVSTLRLPGTLLSSGCTAGPLTWNGYAGGFYLRSRSACVPLRLGVGRRSAVVRVGVGRRCGPVP